MCKHGCDKTSWLAILSLVCLLGSDRSAQAEPWSLVPSHDQQQSTTKRQSAIPTEKPTPLPANHPQIRQWLQKVDADVEYADGTQQSIVKLELGFIRMSIADLESEEEADARFEKELQQVQDQDLEILVNFPELKELSLYGRSFVTDAGAQKIGKYLQKLESLSLSGTEITSAGLRELGSSTTLTHLSLPHHEQITDETLEFIAASYPNLKSLHLCQAAYTGNGLESVGKLKHLEELELQAVNFTNESLAYLKQLPQLKTLRIIYFEEPEKYNLVPVKDLGLAHISEIRSLEQLVLSYAQLGPQGMLRIGELTELQSLSLERCELSGVGLEGIQSLRKLTTFSAWHSPVTDRDLERMAGLDRLTYLNLSGTQVTDAGVKHLIGLPELTVLNLYDTNITDEAIPDLARCYSLEFFSFFGNQVTEYGQNQWDSLWQERQHYIWNDDVGYGGRAEIVFSSETETNAEKTDELTIGFFEIGPFLLMYPKNESPKAPENPNVFPKPTF